MHDSPPIDILQHRNIASNKQEPFELVPRIPDPTTLRNIEISAKGTARDVSVTGNTK